MTFRLFPAVIASILLFAGAANAGAVERACMKSGKQAANSSLCKCIDASARTTLSMSDQNLAGRLIRRPELVERIKDSDRPTNEKFWKEYMEFIKVAESRCSR